MIKYCFESLTELSLTETWEPTVLWRKPFKNINKLYLNIPRFSYFNNQVNLTEIFPSLRHLHIETRNIFEGQLLHFPHLEQMEFPKYEYHSMFSRPRFMEMNPQIRNVHLKLAREGSLELLRVTNEKLADLEVLRITLDAYGPLHDTDPNVTIHFKNVKKIILQTYGETAESLPITFDQLEEVEAIESSWRSEFMRGKTNEKLLNLIVRNQKLRKLNIQYILNTSQWKLIADNLPLLDEITTSWKSRNGSKGLIDLMNKKPNLKKVTLNMELSTDNRTILSGLLYPKWQIDQECKSNLREITFVRSN